MGQRQDIDQLYGRVIGHLVAANRVLDRPALLGIRSATTSAVAESPVLWCDNISVVIAGQLIAEWSGKLPLHKNPG